MMFIKVLFNSEIQNVRKNLVVYWSKKRSLTPKNWQDKPLLWKSKGGQTGDTT